MVKKLKSIVILSLFSFFILPFSFAAVENIKISGDINSEAVNRDLSLGLESNGENNDQFIFSQVRVRFDSDLTEGVSAVVRLINERIWGGTASSGIGDAENSQGNTDINLDLGYLEIKEFFYEPLTLIVGRQELHYGSGLIIGDPDTNQTGSTSKVPTALGDLTLRKSFDAMRAILDFAPWTIDLIFAKAEESTLNLNDDVTIVGTNIAYDWNDYSVSELYFFGTDNAPNPNTGVTTIDSKSKVYALGTRTMFTFNEHLTLGLEGAYQFGDYAAASSASHAHLSAWAALFISEYRFVDAHNSKIGFFYGYLSGDDPETSVYEGWNPMFEDQTPAEISNILLAQTNFQLAGFTASTMPREDLTLNFKYIHARYLWGFAGNVIQVAKGPATGNVAYVNPGKKHLADEFDVSALYDYSEDVQFMLSGAILTFGNVFTDTNDRALYSLRAGVKVNF